MLLDTIFISIYELWPLDVEANYTVSLRGPDVLGKKGHDLNLIIKL